MMFLLWLTRSHLSHPVRSCSGKDAIALAKAETSFGGTNKPDSPIKLGKVSILEAIIGFAAAFASKHTIEPVSQREGITMASHIAKKLGTSLTAPTSLTLGNLLADSLRASASKP